MWDQLVAAINARNSAEAIRLIGQMSPQDFVKDYTKLNYSQSPIHNAAYQGLADVVEQLLNKKPDLIGMVDDLGYTALHRAARGGSEQVVNKLLQLKPDLIGMVDKNGYTALHFAAQNGREPIVTKLLQLKPDLIGMVDKNGYTALHIAAVGGSEQVVNKLLQLKPDLINIVANSGYTALHSAALGGSEQVVNKLLQLKPDLINIVANSGYTALHRAARGGSEQVVNKLLQLKPDLAGMVNKWGETALHLAAENGSEPVVNKLLQLKPDLAGMVTTNGYTALHFAAQDGREPIANKLLQLKPDLAGMVATNGYTALHYAAENGSEPIVNKLLQLKPDLAGMVDKNGKTPLDIADNNSNVNNIKNIRNTQIKLNIYKGKLTPEETKDAAIREIFELIGESNAKIEDKIEKGILLLGKTGTGKSTLTHSLVGKELQAILDDSTGNMIVDAVQPLDAVKISHRSASETKVPNKQVLDNVTIWDCPGFKDTGGIVQEIANAFYIKRLFETTSQLKFILAISESAISSDRGSSAVAIVDQFTKVFTNIQAIKDSVALVVTHVPPHKKVIHLENNIKKILTENNQLQDNENAKQVLEFLLKSVHLFYMPQAEGIIPQTELLQEIEQSAKYMQVQPNLANIAIDPEFMPYAKELLATSQANLSKVTDVITVAVKEANTYLGNNIQNVFMRSHDVIERWLPKSLNKNINTTDNNSYWKEYFAELDLLTSLKNSFEKVSNNQGANKEREAVIDALKIFKEFAATAILKQEIQEYTHVFAQQIEYVKFLSDVCNEKNVDYTCITNTVTNCANTLKTNLEQQIKSLKIDFTQKDIAYYEKAIKYLELYPQDTNCIKAKAASYYHIGTIYEDKHEPDKALANYVKGIKFDKTLSTTYEKVGDLLFTNKDFGKALNYFKVIHNTIKVNNCFEELIKLKPNDCNIRVEKGDYYLSAGRYEKAVGYYQQAFSLSHDESFKATTWQKISNALTSQSNQLQIKAQEYSDNATNKNFFEYDLVNVDELNDYHISTTGDIYYG